MRPSNPLTSRQKEVYDFIVEQLAGGHPFPSLAEIARAFGMASRNAAKSHLSALEKKGYIRKRKQRTGDFFLSSQSPSLHLTSPQHFKLVGEISAGAPVESEDFSSEFICFDQKFFGQGELQVVRVSGDSMSGDAICDGDLAIIDLRPKNLKQNDILALRVAGEGVTLKRVYPHPENKQKREHKKCPEVYLIPSNPSFKERKVLKSDLEVLGKWIGLVRKN